MIEELGEGGAVTFAPGEAECGGRGGHPASDLKGETIDEAASHVSIVELLAEDWRTVGPGEAVNRFVEDDGLVGIGVVHQVTPDQTGTIRQPVRELVRCGQEEESRGTDAIAAENDDGRLLPIARASAEVNVNRPVRLPALVGGDLLHTRSAP